MPGVGIWVCPGSEPRSPKDRGGGGHWASPPTLWRTAPYPHPQRLPSGQSFAAKKSSGFSLDTPIDTVAAPRPHTPRPSGTDLPPRPPNPRRTSPPMTPPPIWSRVVCQSQGQAHISTTKPLISGTVGAFRSGRRVAGDMQYPPPLRARRRGTVCVTQSRPLGPLRTGAAPNPWRPSHAGSHPHDSEVWRALPTASDVGHATKSGDGHDLSTMAGCSLGLAAEHENSERSCAAACYEPPIWGGGGGAGVF